jgi:Tol biopolymer transport system component
MQAKQLPIPETDEPDDWSRDGKWIVTVSDRHPPHGSGYQLYLMHPDGTGERRLTEGGLNCYPKFSHDGKRLAHYRSKSRLGRLAVMDVDGSNSKEILTEKEDGSGAPDHASWSPDSKWLAVKLHDWQVQTTAEGKKEKVNKFGEGNDRIEIISADGSHRRPLDLQGVDKIVAISEPDWY